MLKIIIQGFLLDFIFFSLLFTTILFHFQLQFFEVMLIMFSEQISLHRQDSEISLPIPDVNPSAESVFSLLEEGFRSNRSPRELDSSSNNLSDYEENYTPTIFSVGERYETSSRRSLFYTLITNSFR